MGAQEALRKGMVHELAPAADIVERAKRWLLTSPEALQPWDRKGFRVPGGAGMSSTRRRAGLHGGHGTDGARNDAQLPGAARHPDRGVRGHPGADRHGTQDRVATVRPPARRSGRPQPDADDVREQGSRGQAVPPSVRSCKGTGAAAWRAGCRDDGRWRRACLRRRRHRGRAARHDHRAGRKGQGSRATAPRARGRARPAYAGGRRRAARAAYDRPRATRDLAGCDLVVEAVFEKPRHQGRRYPAGGSGDRAVHGIREQYFDLADLGSRAGLEAAGAVHRDPFLLAGREDAPGRDHRGQEDVRGNARPCARLRRTAPQDADRRQRQPRLLHQPLLRCVRVRGHADACRGCRARADRERRPHGGHAGRSTGGGGRSHDRPAMEGHPPDRSRISGSAFRSRRPTTSCAGSSKS